MQKMPNMQPIGNLLAKRRKELGLSIDKAAEATKLRRHVIEAFEYTDFDAMPPKGYARASMGSYARYLGLNTSEVLRAFDEQLAEYEARQQGYARQDERFQQASSRDASRQDERRRDTRSDQRAGYRQDTRQPQTGRSQGASSPMRTPTRPASSEARAQRGADSRSTYGRPTSSARTSTPAPGRYEAPARRGRAPMAPLAGARVRALPQPVHIRVSAQALVLARLPSRSTSTAGMREAAAAGREDATKRRMPHSRAFRKCSRASSRPSWPTGASCSFLWASLPSCSLW